jgi:uncharacterized protein
MLEEASRAAAHAARASLAEAERLLATEDAVGATAALSMTDTGALSGSERARAGLLGAELARRTGDNARAQALLSKIKQADATTTLLAEALRTTLERDPASGARLLMAAAADDDAQPRVHDALWSLLEETDPLLALAESSRGSSIDQGWWQLRLTTVMSLSAADRSARVRRWITSHPEHPAAKVLPRVLRERAEPGPNHIALLLPDGGPLAAAGRAVRNGFMAAWLELEPPARPRVTFHDTESADIASVLAAARAAGADLIIGPLQREQVAALNALTPEIPVLALNNLGTTPPAPQLHQFGLAPEDEMASLAEWLVDSGAERVLVLRGPHEWALRLERALEETGQKPVGSYLMPELRTVTDTVGSAMLIAASEARHAELQRITGLPLAFAPRARQDVDAIVTLVDGLEITALVPALEFHYADRIPAFAPALTLQGADETTLKVMEGFHVVELPWSLPGMTGQQDLLQAFSTGSGALASLYALGADALRMADRVWRGQRGQRSWTLGYTGSLMLEEDGRVRRTLARMEILGGTRVPDQGLPASTRADAGPAPGP